MSGGNRGINMRSEREVLGLVRVLEAQGARAEMTGNGFPIRVYPPDPTKHFILFHGSVSDANAATLKRTEVRRAGLRWPGDDGISAKHLRKAGTPGMRPITTTEDSMTMTDDKPGSRAHGTHLVEPAGVRSFGKPSTTTRERLAPLMEAMPDALWTDHALAVVRNADVPGYASSKGMQRMQAMLDYFGFRVVDTRPNRNGLSYRWFREVEPRTDVAERNTNLTIVTVADAIAAEAPVAEVTPSLPADAGPIAAAFAEAEKKRQEKAKHERATCPVCDRHFTPSGLAHHYEETGHDKQEPVIPAGFEVFEKPKVHVDPEHPHEETAPAAAVEDQRDEAAEWQALIAEAEAETARVRAELDTAKAALQTMREAAAAIGEDRDAERLRGDRQATLLQQRKADLDEATRKQEKAERLAADLQASMLEAAPAADESWLVDPQSVGLKQVGNLIAEGLALGVTIEVRARRA